MWSNRNQETELRVLLSRIERAREPTHALIAETLNCACPRLKSSLAPNDLVLRLIDAEAWVDLALWLIGWELPDWDVHQLSCGDQSWNCSICIRGLARNWADDIAQFQHGSLALAIFGALVEAQLRKLEGCAASNVTAFRRREPAIPERGTTAAFGLSPSRT
jgi:hypothetical protein